MKIDDLLKVASDFPLPSYKRVEIDDETLLSLEQLPQLLKLLNPESILWNYNSIIIGPDGTQIETIGKQNNNKKYFFLSPLYESSIGWNIHLDLNQIVKMIYDLLPCREGESYFNPSFWVREDIVNGKKIFMESGEINEKLKERESSLTFYEKEVKLELGYVNPIYTFLNPFIISHSKKILGKSEFYSLTMNETYSFIGEDKLEIQNNMGTIKVESLGKIAAIRSKTWKEAKPYEIYWNMKNKIKKIDCKLSFPISFYKIYPSGIIPFFLRYENNTLTLGLINLNDNPIIANLILAARIEDVSILSPQGNETEKLNSEFDRVKIPIRKFGVLYVRLKVKKLLESFLKRKIIST